MKGHAYTNFPGCLSLFRAVYRGKKEHLIRRYPAYTVTKRKII